MGFRVRDVLCGNFHKNAKFWQLQSHLNGETRFPPPQAIARHKIMSALSISPPQALRARASLRGQWIVFAGDSTHRDVHSNFVSLLSLVGLRLQGIGLPRLDGEPILDIDRQKDTDFVGDARCSLRFLRGLDLDKLALSAANWRQRYFYADMAASLLTPFSLLPLTYRSVFAPDSDASSDGDNATTRTAALVEDRREPDVLILHSCAWDLPAINRSKTHYPLLDRGHTLIENLGRLYNRCPSELPATAPMPLRHATIEQPRWGAARVAASPCISRGDGLSDEIIYAGYAARLHASIHLLRRSFHGRLLLRNCHAGMVRSRQLQLSPQERLQTEQIHHMNALIARVAAERRVELIDVFAVDRELSGHVAAYHDGGRTDFHVPRNASAAAALVILWHLLRGRPPSSIAEVRRDFQERPT